MLFQTGLAAEAALGKKLGAGGPDRIRGTWIEAEQVPLNQPDGQCSRNCVLKGRLGEGRSNTQGASQGVPTLQWRI